MYNTLSQPYSWRENSLEWPLTSETGPGLSGVIACETGISWIDVAKGELYYRGINIRDLAGHCSFEEIAFLLITGNKPAENRAEYKTFLEQVYGARILPEPVVEIVKGLPPDAHPTRLLRAGVSALGCYAMTPGEEYRDQHMWNDFAVIGQVAQLVTIIINLKRDAFTFDYGAEVSLSYNLLLNILWRTPDEDEVRLLNLGWMLYADHGLDAPTFTGMIVGSTLADPYYNIVAGLSALRGPKLGGTGEQVLKQLLAFRDENVACAWARGMLSMKWKIPGFGHRMYATEDPRVQILKRELRKYAASIGEEEVLDVAEAVEKVVSEQLAPKGIFVNINYYAAILFHLLGVEPELVPCMYAIGRMAGVIARLREYATHNRLFRPDEEYMGPLDLPYIPREE